MKSPQRIWARSLLALCNTLLALALVGLAIIAFATGREHHVGSSVWLTVLPALGLATVFGALIGQLAKRRGRVLQTVVAVGALGLSALTSWWALPGVYGVFALLVVWWLGDFDGSGPPPAKRLEGTPTEVARFMWRRGDGYGAIRAELARRAMPVDEIERLVYELTVEEQRREGARKP
jgi:hypothetical protein